MGADSSLDVFTIVISAVTCITLLSLLAMCMMKVRHRIEEDLHWECRPIGWPCRDHKEEDLADDKEDVLSPPKTPHIIPVSKGTVTEKQTSVSKGTMTKKEEPESSDADSVKHPVQGHRAAFTVQGDATGNSAILVQVASARRDLQQVSFTATNERSGTQLSVTLSFPGKEEEGKPTATKVD